MTRKKAGRRRTVVGKANSNNNSLRVTIPNFVVEVLELQAQDVLEWSVEMFPVVTVRVVEPASGSMKSDEHGDE